MHQEYAKKCLVKIDIEYELCYKCKFKDKIYNENRENNNKYYYKVYLAVPFSDKEEAKQLGAKWDGNTKQWYAPNGEIELVNNKKWQINKK